jgi:acyl-CoA synthetase (AMP-forming)/AMP-acid ligase II
VQPLLVGDVLSLAAHRSPKRVAASFGDTELRFAELETDAQRLTRALAGQGLTVGDRIVWCGSTTISAIPLWFAAARIGVAFIPLNPAATKSEVNGILGRIDARLVIGDEVSAGITSISELHRDASLTGVGQPNIDETSTHVVFFTSGSSDVPKGVELSHRALRLRMMIDQTQAPNGPTLCMFPHFHTAGWYGPMTAWANGDEVVYVERADAESILEAIHRRRVTRLYAIPAVWRRILDADLNNFDLECLRMCDTGTSATSAALLDEIAQRFPGTATSVTYGSTEAGGVCRLWPEDVHRKPGSVGPSAPGCEIRLEADKELVVRSPFLFSGYFRDPVNTSASLHNGWFRTGDLAECDEEGYYSIVGRSKEIIRTGGESVAPVEIDQILAGMPGVVDIAVAGVPDVAWGEVITAFAVLEPGAVVTLDDLQSRCAGTLARFKHPRRLEIRESLPRTGATRQIQRSLLVQSVIDQGCGEPSDATPAPSGHSSERYSD